MNSEQGFNEMNINPEEPKMEERDRLVLSKGHASACLYATLAQKGFFNKEDLKTFRKIELKNKNDGIQYE